MKPATSDKIPSNVGQDPIIERAMAELEKKLTEQRALNLELYRITLERIARRLEETRSDLAGYERRNKK